MADDISREIETQRSSLLRRLETRMEVPMALLGLVWLALLVLEFSLVSERMVSTAGRAIWVVFVLDFALKFAVAPHKTVFLRRNLLTVLSLLLPALRAWRVLRMFRLLRAARAARGVRLLRLLSSLNRAVRSLSRTLRRRGAGYVMLLTLLVLFVGAAGILAVEGPQTGPGGGIAGYGDALWWTAMLLVTMGSDVWPRSAEGRVLCLLLALYGFSMLGYVTATLASFFVERDRMPRP